MQTKREFLTTAAVGGTAAAVVASCNQQGGVDMVAITTAINNVQQAVAKGCAFIGNVVPQANSIWALLASLMNVPVSGAVAVTAAAVEGAIALITKAACPSSLTPPAGGKLTAPEFIQVTPAEGATPIKIDFIKFS